MVYTFAIFKRGWSQRSLVATADILLFWRRVGFLYFFLFYETYENTPLFAWWGSLVRYEHPDAPLKTAERKMPLPVLCPGTIGGRVRRQ